MDWEQLRERTLGEVATSLVTSGAGVAGGFIGAAFVGRQVQNMVKTDDDITSATDAIMAWGANNIPKLAIWYLTKGYALEPGEAVTSTKEAISDARKAMAGSVVFDTLMRLANSGKNPATATLWGWQVLGEGSTQHKSAQADVQRLIQENSALRAELNKALQRLATPPVIQPPMAPVTPPVVQAAPAPPVQPPVQTVRQQPPPVVRYTPVTPQQISARPAPARPTVRAEAMAPVTRVVQPAARPVAPTVRAEAMAPITRVVQPAVRPAAPTVRVEPLAAQPVPPAAAERERRYGFMQYETTPPVVQERERKFGFMAGGEKDIATMFGML